MLPWVAMAGRSPGTAGSLNAGTRLPMPETALSLCAGISGNGGQVRGNLPAIATHADTVAATCTWRWQAGGGQVAWSPSTSAEPRDPPASRCEALRAGAGRGEGDRRAGILDFARLPSPGAKATGGQGFWILDGFRVFLGAVVVDVI